MSETIQDIDHASDTAALFGRVAHWISQLQRLSDIFKATVTEVGEFLEADRVKIYQFQPDGCGQVIAEHIREERLPSLLGLMFPADDIPPEARELFIRARARSIVDLSTQCIGQSLAHDQNTYDDLRYRPVDPCHVEYLTAMGVQSTLVIPILHQDQLWGLLVTHTVEPKLFTDSQLQAVQMVVDLLMVAIAQSILTEKACQQAEREATLNRIGRLLHSLSTIELQTALEDAIGAFQGAGGRLWINAKSLDSSQTACSEAKLPSRRVRLYKAGDQPIMPESAPFPLIEQYHAWQEHFQSDQDNLWAITDLYKEPKLRNLQSAFRSTKIRSMLMIPLWYRQQLLGYLSIFRDEIETEILWAGQFDPDQRQLYPRQSFEIWKESRRGQALPWTEIEIELAKALGQQFATAIEQYETHQQLQALNANLEHQVEERTATLSEALQTLQKTQTQLIQNEKMSSLGQLVAGVAHEINNPVNFIHGNLTHINAYVNDLLNLIHTYQTCYPTPASEITDHMEDIDLEFLSEDLPKTLTSMKLGTERIRQIVLSLRNFSRLDQADMKPVDIHEGIDSTLLILQHRLKTKENGSKIELIKEYADLPLVGCYPSQLNQVFMNVLSNAIDTLEEAGSHQETPTIRVTTEPIGDQSVVIRIADNGLGIPPHVQAQIFEPFFTTKPIGKGTGMGLSISYSIVVEKHRGILKCHSEPGQGTEFWIEIPLRQENKSR
jgi:light-regulated signal transduction histidine kinase (bacteriophytochrome)